MTEGDKPRDICAICDTVWCTRREIVSQGGRVVKGRQINPLSCPAPTIRRRRVTDQPIEECPIFLQLGN